MAEHPSSLLCQTHPQMMALGEKKPSVPAKRVDALALLTHARLSSPSSSDDDRACGPIDPPSSLLCQTHPQMMVRGAEGQPLPAKHVDVLALCTRARLGSPSSPGDGRACGPIATLFRRRKD